MLALRVLSLRLIWGLLPRSGEVAALRLIGTFIELGGELRYRRPCESALGGRIGGSKGRGEDGGGDAGSGAMTL